MARNDATVTPDDSAEGPTSRRDPDPKPAEYPEITSGPLTPRRPPAVAGRRGSVTPVDPRDRPAGTRR